MLHNLLNQTVEILNPKVTGSDEYGNDTQEYDPAGTFPCRVQPWKGQEFEVDRDTRRTWYRIIMDERAAGVLEGRSRLLLSINSQMGKIPTSTQSGPEDTTTQFEVFGDPQIYRSRTRIVSVEAVIRTTEG